MTLNFTGYANLVSAISKRCDKNMSLCYGDTTRSLENRRFFLESLGIDYQDLICARQVHGNSVRYVKQEEKGKGALYHLDALDGTDALITDKPNLPLAIFTADCLSIFLYDCRHSAIGLIHAGRRSTEEDITIKTIKLMREIFDTDSQDLSVGFGPAIRNCCYEVDLIGMNKKQLLDLEVKEKNIFDSTICTSCRNQEFFSYRKEGNSCGRMMSVIMLK